MEKAKTATEGASRTTLGFRQLLSWPHPKRNNFRSVPWLLPLPLPSSFPSAFFGHFPPEYKLLGGLFPCTCFSCDVTAVITQPLLDGRLQLFLGSFLFYYYFMVIFRDGPRSELHKRSTPTVWESLELESDPFISPGLSLDNVTPEPQV